MAWDVFDEDGSGALDAEELKTAMLLMGERVSPEKLNELFKEADKGCSEAINFEAFVMLLQKVGETDAAMVDLVAAAYEGEAKVKKGKSVHRGWKCIRGVLIGSQGFKKAGKLNPLVARVAALGRAEAAKKG